MRHGWRNGVLLKSEDDATGVIAEAPLDRALVAIPEHSHPGESQSNGLSEKAIQEIVDHIRTLKMSTEGRLGVRIPNDHPLMSWIAEHATYLLNRYQLSTDGRTAYGRIHGKESTARICEFAERVLWYVPKKHRAKLDARWRYGVFLGRALDSDQNFVGLSNGTVVCARAIIRLNSRLRWNSEKAMAITGVPMDTKTQHFDVIEQDDEPHVHAEPVDDPEAESQGFRRLRITQDHMRLHGYSDGCPRCNLHQQGLHVRAKHLRHSEACRSRIYNAIKG